MRSSVTQKCLSAVEVGKASKMTKTRGKRVTPDTLSKNHSQIQIGHQQQQTAVLRPRSRSGTNQKNASTFDFQQKETKPQEERNCGKKFIDSLKPSSQLSKNEIDCQLRYEYARGGSKPRQPNNVIQDDVQMVEHDKTRTKSRSATPTKQQQVYTQVRFNHYKTAVDQDMAAPQQENAENIDTSITNEPKSLQVNDRAGSSNRVAGEQMSGILSNQPSLNQKRSLE